MSYGYMPGCCSVYTDADLARIKSNRNDDKIKSLEKEVETLKQKLDSVLAIEPKTGKLTKHLLKNANVPWGYDCSVCGAWFVIGEDTAEKYRYCPNCGAKMERSEE